jgi:hypothetical protein
LDNELVLGDVDGKIFVAVVGLAKEEGAMIVGLSFRVGRVAAGLVVEEENSVLARRVSVGDERCRCCVEPPFRGDQIDSSEAKVRGAAFSACA